MARFVKTFQASRLTDQVVGVTTYPGLITQVNTFLATLVNPTIRYINFVVAHPDKRIGEEYIVELSYQDGGAVLATPFLLVVDLAASLTLLEQATQAYLTTNAAYFVSGVRFTFLDQDNNRLARFWNWYLANTTGGASANFLPL